MLVYIQELNLQCGLEQQMNARADPPIKCLVEYQQLLFCLGVPNLHLSILQFLHLVLAKNGFGR